MSFITILETLLIGPLKLLFEIIFQVANKFVNHPGLSIIFLSLVMNILVLPLYKRADAMQEEARDTDLKLSRGVNHIKKVFSGDEKMMILQTYYRQNNYKPTDALNGSVSLLLEIPFFMAAYQFLSHLQVLNGVSLGPISDLSKPDGLLVFGSVAINVLPILMTLVNVISSALYLKGFPLKTKIQLYGMALFFLVFLYTSPSGLVFYWTLNNVFSLVKTIFYKLKNPKKVLGILTSLVGLAALVFSTFFYGASGKKKLFLIVLGVLLQLPLLLPILKAKLPAPKKASIEAEPNKKLFILAGLFLTVLLGLVIPSTFIADSPQEYVDVSWFHNPLWYVVSSVAMAAGFFLIWMRVFYWLASKKGKVIFDRLMWILCGVMLVNYMFFGTDLGVISASLQYEMGMSFQLSEQLINLGVIIALAAVLYFVVRKWNKAVPAILLTGVLAFGIMSGVNLVNINNSISSISLEQYEDTPHFQLSKEGKNVVVLMMDRAMGTQIPYLINEKPELKEQFAGFTYYSNTISFGGQTNFGTPPLLGGYEYTPVELNKRDGESLVSKQNEANLVMPVLFNQNGFQVTVCDPIYTNYTWIPDLSIFDEYPDINAYVTTGAFSDPATKQAVIDNNHRNFFCFSLMKSLPLFLQSAVYDNGTYNQAALATEELVYSVQTRHTKTVSQGILKDFMDNYNVLKSLPGITNITQDDSNTFLFLSNNLTHWPMMLQEPDYTPAEYVDNTAIYAGSNDRFTVDGVTMDMSTEDQVIHYQTNMAMLMVLGDWMDYLREQGVYDNTRIIIVADHGRALYQFEDLIHDPSSMYKNAEYYAPLLMVKDFGSTKFTISDEFMTNADVPTLATAGLIENPTNPFTGAPINSDEKTAHDQYIILSEDWNVTHYTGNTFHPSAWASVKDNMWDPDNWSYYDEEVILTEHTFPES